MLHDAPADGTGPPGGTPGLRLFRPKLPATALGLAVAHLMTKPAFANLKFGDWARILVGQINRGHYLFVVDEQKEVVGFLGWAVTTRERAEAWVEGREGLPDRHANEGDCMLLNAWAADDNRVTRFILDTLRVVGRDMKTIYYKRHYKDGSIRPVRLSVNDFVGRHVARAAGAVGEARSGPAADVKAPAPAAATPQET